MPKMRPITKQNTEHLTKVVHEGFSSLLVVRSILSGHFKRDEHVRKRIQKFVEDYADFKKECQREFTTRVKKQN